MKLPCRSPSGFVHIARLKIEPADSKQTVKMARTLPCARGLNHSRPLHDRVRRQLAGLSTTLDLSELTDITNAIIRDPKNIASNSTSASISESTTLGSGPPRPQSLRAVHDPTYVLEGPQEELDRKPLLEEEDALLIVSLTLSACQHSVDPNPADDIPERACQGGNLARTAFNSCSPYEGAWHPRP